MTEIMKNYLWQWLYMVGFNTYMGFGNKVQRDLKLGYDKDGILKHIYEYVKHFG